jgi:hypothetical protein
MASAICFGVALSEVFVASATGESFVGGRKKEGGAALPRRRSGFYTNLEGTRSMADATTAARDRVDRALALLERRIDDLKAAPSPPDDDLFAVPPRPSLDAAVQQRVAELEAAGRDAAEALARAADAVREILSDQPSQDVD